MTLERKFYEIELEARAEGMAKGLAEGRAEGIKQGKAEGIKQGKAEGIKENINTMHKNGFDLETIARALSLDINYVKKVKMCTFNKTENKDNNNSQK